MKYIFLIAIACFATLNSKAHSPIASDLMLVQEEDLSWTLQVRSALDAYRAEVKRHFADQPYATPEQFQAQVLDHFDHTLSIWVNEKEVDLGQGVVKLGHETLVFYKDIELPSDLASIKISGKMFQDINKSKVAVIILKEDIERKAFTLNNENEFMTYLKVENNKLHAYASAENTNTWDWILLYVVVFVPLLLLSIYMLYSKNMEHDKRELAVAPAINRA